MDIEYSKKRATKSHKKIVEEDRKAKENHMTYGQWVSQQYLKSMHTSRVPEGYLRVKDRVKDLSMN